MWKLSPLTHFASSSAPPLFRTRFVEFGLHSNAIDRHPRCHSLNLIILSILCVIICDIEHLLDFCWNEQTGTYFIIIPSKTDKLDCMYQLCEIQAVNGPILPLLKD